MTAIRPMRDVIDGMEASVAARDERERVALYVGCARRARLLAHGWLISARNYPRYADVDNVEARKAFARARDYLGVARRIRDNE